MSITVTATNTLVAHMTIVTNNNQQHRDLADLYDKITPDETTQSHPICLGKNLNERTTYQSTVRIVSIESALS